LTGVEIDPATLISAKGAEELNSVSQPLWLPSWIPQEFSAASPQFVVFEEGNEYSIDFTLSFVDGQPLAIELDSDVTIRLSRVPIVDPLDSSEPPIELPVGETVQGSERSYTVDTPACPSLPDSEGAGGGPLLLWADSTFVYSVEIVPLPGCIGPFTLDHAFQFVEELVECQVADGSIECTSVT
jgi:hypothetical protein